MKTAEEAVGVEFMGQDDADVRENMTRQGGVDANILLQALSHIAPPYR